MSVFGSSAAPAGHILIAEDSPVQAKRLRFLLESASYRVTVTGDGHGALATARADTPAAIISDVMMPGMNGYELCAAVKVDQALRAIPVILMSSLSDPHNIIQALQAGADTFITKPYDDDYLVSQLQNTLASRSLRFGRFGEEDSTDIVYGGERYSIRAERQQMLDLLLSVFAAAVQKNNELQQAQDDLQRLNEQLEQKVLDRTAALIAENAERRQAEISLRESEATFRSLFANSRDALLILDGEAILDGNEAALDLLGCRSREELLVTDLCCRASPHRQPDGRLSAEAMAERLAVAKDTGRQLFEWEFVRSDGATFPGEVLLSRMEVQGRSVIQASIRDITARRKSEEAGRLWLAAMRATSDLVMMTDPSGTIAYVNRAFVDTTCHAEDQAVGQPATELLHTAGRDESVLAELQQTIRDGRVWQGQLVQQRRDGSPFTVRATITPILAGDGSIVEYVWTEQNITEELEAQKRLSRAQTLEAVGQLSAGVAHDFNNLLQAVIVSAEMLADCVAGDEDGCDLVTQIRDVSMRGAGLVRQLLLFSRQEVDEPELLDLNHVVGEVEKLLRRTIGEDITLACELAPELPSVLASGVQMQQVLMNLAVNARDAMPTGGSLTIATRNVASTGEICLSVTDTGVGMPPEVMARIFEPYFTTKTLAGGTGLGLATVYGVVNKIGGRLTVDSQPGAGTRFEVFLPARVAIDAPAVTKESAAPAPAGTGEVVLVVDDEDVIRRLLCRLLSRNGYQVLDAASGEEAVALVDGQRAAVDLLVTDVIMPTMSGPQVAEALVARNPSLRVLFMSGYADDRLFVHGMERDQTHFISKPFSAEAALAKIREVLGA